MSTPLNSPTECRRQNILANYYGGILSIYLTIILLNIPYVLMSLNFHMLAASCNEYLFLVSLQDAATLWSQQPLAAREHAFDTINTYTVLMNISNDTKDLIEREVSAFYQSPDNSLYMLPSTPQVNGLHNKLSCVIIVY